MTTNSTTSRRDLLGAIVAAPFAVALTAHAATSDADPIFAAIERAHQADTAFNDALDDLAHAERTYGFNSPEAKRAHLEREEPTSNAQEAAFLAFLECVPTSRAGLAAKIAACNEPWAWGCGISAEPEHLAALLQSIAACLKLIDGRPSPEGSSHVAVAPIASVPAAPVPRCLDGDVAELTGQLETKLSRRWPDASISITRFVHDGWKSSYLLTVIR